MVVYFINDVWDEKALAYFTFKIATLPVKGEAYTIREVIYVKENFYLLLHEVVNILEPDVCFHYSRFSHEKPDGDMVNVLDFETVREIYKNQINEIIK